MESLKTNKLLCELVKYTFYDWEDENEDKKILHFGMPDDLIITLGYPNFYGSWGYEAVGNPYANPSFSSEQWLLFESNFFQWLKEAKDVFLPNGFSIVTPQLSNWWLPTEIHPPKWTIENKWKKKNYDSYVKLLTDSNVMKLTPPSLETDYRGAIIESYEDFEVIGKMATRNQSLLFFCGEDRVIRLTNYLSVMIECNSEDTKHNIQTILTKTINPRFF